MLSSYALRRMALAALVSTGVGGTATSTIPGLEHWPPGTVAVVVAAVVALGAVMRKVLHAALIALAVTVALIVVDAATGGHIQQALNLGALLPGGSA